MLIERQLAPALLMVGGAIVLPEVLAVSRGLPVQPSVGALVAGNLLGGLGLLTSALTFLDRDHHLIWRTMVLLILVTLTVLFSGGTVFVAAELGGSRAILSAVAALAPVLGTGVGSYRALKEPD